MPDYRCYMYLTAKPSEWRVKTILARDPMLARAAYFQWRDHPDRGNVHRTLVVFEQVTSVSPGSASGLSVIEAYAKALLREMKRLGEEGKMYILDPETGEPYLRQDEGGESVDTKPGKPMTEIVQDWQAKFEGDSIQAQAFRAKVSDAAWQATHAACGGGTPREVAPYEAKPEPCQKAQLAKAAPYVPKPDPPSARYAYHAARRAAKK